MTERTFEVFILRYNRKALVYPGQTGEVALANMAKLKTRGFDTVARTSANGITEDLSLDDMREIFGPEPAPRSAVAVERQSG